MFNNGSIQTGIQFYCITAPGYDPDTTVAMAQYWLINAGAPVEAVIDGNHNQCASNEFQVDEVRTDSNSGSAGGYAAWFNWGQPFTFVIP